MSQTITFGELTFEYSKTAPLVGGVTENRPFDYPTDVRYKNINPTVNITRAACPPDTFAPIKGALVEGVPIQVVAQSEGATLQAVKKRCDHAPASDVGAGFKRGHDLLMDKIHERDMIRLDSESVRAYLDEMSGQKRERLQACLDAADFTLPGYTDKTVFAKSEVLVKTDGSQPRVVYQGGDMYNLVMGSVVYYLSRRIAEELNRTNPRNKGNEVIYCVGMTADEIADIVHHTSGNVFENDFKNNDGTQPAGVRKWEAMFYYKLGAPKWFVREFASNTSVRVFTRYGVKGRVKGQRWSGEVTTTTGNGYVNACTSLAALEQAGITASTTLVYGDDGLTYTSQDRSSVKKAFEDVAAGSGMKTEGKCLDTRESATFLRKRFVPSFTKTFPVPSFGRVVCKLPVRCNNNKAVSDNDYMAGKVLSAAYEHRHVARVRELLLQTAEQLSAVPYLDFRNQACAYKYTAAELKDMTINADVVDPDCFHSFLNKVYGINEDALVDCYASVCDGILGFQRVNRNAVDHKKKPPPLAPKIPRALWDTAFESIVSVDVSL
jgi:hypothetical protein